MGDLMLHLREAIAEPTDLIKQGIAPLPYFFALEPLGRDQDEREKFAVLLAAPAMARLCASLNLAMQSANHDSASPYCLSNPSDYVGGFTKKTEATIEPFTKGTLAPMYQQREGPTTTNTDLEVTRAQLHDVVISRIFDGVDQAGQTQRVELDKALTRFAAALRPFSALGSQALPELKHAVIVNYVKSVSTTSGGGGGGDIYIHTPCIRIVTFSVTPRDWELALQKSTSNTNERIPFHLSTAILDLEVNEAEYSSWRPKFDGIFKSIAKGDDELQRIAESGGLEALGRRTCTVYQAAGM